MALPASPPTGVTSSGLTLRLTFRAWTFQAAAFDMHGHHLAGQAQGRQEDLLAGQKRGAGAGAGSGVRSASSCA